MNVQRSLIWELMLYEFEPGWGGALRHRINQKHLMCKFHSGCKNADDQARKGWPKTVDSEAVLQTIKANPVSSIWRILGKLGISQSRVVCHLHDPSKSIQRCRIMFHLRILFFLKGIVAL